MALRDDFTLRLMDEQDLPLVLQWRNSERIRANMYTDHVISLEEHTSWFLTAKDDKKARYLIFEYKNRPVGVVNVTQIDLQNKKAYWGFYLGDSDVPRASGAIMEFLALEYIFKNLGIRKLYCEVFAFNEPVIKLHKKFGFVEEGRFVQHVWKKDRFEDVISLAIFSETWTESAAKLEAICFR